MTMAISLMEMGVVTNVDLNVGTATRHLYSVLIGVVVACAILLDLPTILHVCSRVSPLVAVLHL